MLNQPETKPDYFIQIPPDVLFESKLSAGAKLFYGEVLFLTYTYGFCSQKNAYFSANHSVSLRTVENWIKELKNKNLIKIELIRKQNKEVELRKIFALANIDFSKSPGANKSSDSAMNSLPDADARKKSAQSKKKPYGVNQNVFLSDNEMEELLKTRSKEQIEKAINLYSDWKISKGANPRSDFNSMQWAIREVENPSVKTGRRLTSVQESGCDEVSEETLANLPF